MLVSHTYTFAIDPAEQEPEKLPEPAPAEVLKLELWNLW
jgi:hypothetical protein